MIPWAASILQRPRLLTGEARHVIDVSQPHPRNDRPRGVFGMPEVSRFLGIIAMYFRDYAPPHFHVRYAGCRASVRLNPLGSLEGHLHHMRSVL